MVKKKETKITTSVKPTLLIKPEPEKKKIGRPKKVKPPVDKISAKEFGEAVHEKLLKDTADNWLTNEAIKYRADFLEERNRYLQTEVVKADNIAGELSLVRNHLKILHSRSEKILHLMNKPVESTKTEAVCDAENTDRSKRDEDGYNVDTNKKEMVDVRGLYVDSEGKFRTMHEPRDSSPITKGQFNQKAKLWAKWLSKVDNRVDTVVIWNWVLFIVIFIALIILFIKTF